MHDYREWSLNELIADEKGELYKEERYLWVIFSQRHTDRPETLYIRRIKASLN